MRTALTLRARRLLPLVALLAAGGCFATRNDVRLVQTDLATLRADVTKHDEAARANLTQAIKLLQVATDSLARVSSRTVSIQGDVRGEMRSIKEQLLQIQQLLGQSQATIARLRAELAERAGQAAPLVPPTFGLAGADTTAATRTTGPLELYQNARDQLNRGSTTTARSLFQELLNKYPSHEYAPQAQYWLATTYEKEKNLGAADAAYAAVVTKYENAPEAPMALYKRAMLFIQQANNAKARELLDQIIKRYPRSDEAVRAAELLPTLR